MNRLIVISVSAAAIFLAWPSSLHAETTIFTRVTGIIDGVTLELSTIVSTQQTSRSLHVSLTGVALPDFYSDAHLFLTKFVLNTTVTAIVHGDFSSGYLTGRVFNSEAVDIAELMVRKGMVYRAYDDGIYERAERIAKFNAAGMWGNTWASVKHPDEEIAPSHTKKTAKHIGKYYKLRICGNDSLYQYGNATNCFIVQQDVAGSDVPRQFVLICKSPRMIRKLEDKRYRVIYVKLVNKAVLRSGKGTTTVLPILREVGKSRYLGVRGELLYFK